MLFVKKFQQHNLSPVILLVLKNADQQSVVLQFLETSGLKVSPLNIEGGASSQRCLVNRSDVPACILLQSTKNLKIVPDAVSQRARNFQFDRALLHNLLP